MKKKINYKGADVIYTDQGEGRCMVLLHGYLERGEIWQPFIEQFPGNFRFILPDLPGHGESGNWGRVHSMDDLAASVNAILEAEGIEKVVLAGHSMGGYVCMAFAELFPEKLSAYSLVHSTPFADTREKQDMREREISLVLCGKKRQIVMVNIPKAFATENLDRMAKKVKELKEMALGSPDQGTMALLNGMKDRPDRSGILKDPGIPLLLIGGMKDNYIPPEVFEKLPGLAPHAKVLRLENSGHMGFLEEPDLVLKAFLDFTEELSQ